MYTFVWQCNWMGTYGKSGQIGTRDTGQLFSKPELVAEYSLKDHNLFPIRNAVIRAYRMIIIDKHYSRKEKGCIEHKPRVSELTQVLQKETGPVVVYFKGKHGNEKLNGRMLIERKLIDFLPQYTSD